MELQLPLHNNFVIYDVERVAIDKSIEEKQIE